MVLCSLASSRNRSDLEYNSEAPFCMRAIQTCPATQATSLQQAQPERQSERQRATRLLLRASLFAVGRVPTLNQLVTPFVSAPPRRSQSARAQDPLNESRLLAAVGEERSIVRVPVSFRGESRSQ